MLIFKIVDGENYVADDWFGCASDGRKESKNDFNLSRLVWRNRKVSINENISFIFRITHTDPCGLMNCILAQSYVRDLYVAVGIVRYAPTARY